jgi:hypothetical protein
MHDPRQKKRLSARDIRALTFVGEGYEVAQYQLHAAVFPTVSAFVVSRFVKRAVANEWIAVERWNRVGINRLRLTRAGKDRLVAEGVDSVSLFTPRKPVAMKDVAHTLWINDVRVVLLAARPPFEWVLPAWQIQRRIFSAPSAIPDVLAIRKAMPAGIFVYEVDLGGESLASVFLPKLASLQAIVTDWRGALHSEILVLTTSGRRAAAIRRGLASLHVQGGVEILVDELPKGILGAARGQTLGRTLMARWVWKPTLCQ